MTPNKSFNIKEILIQGDRSFLSLQEAQQLGRPKFLHIFEDTLY